MTAPDLAAAVLGFRVWETDRDGRLHPIAIGTAPAWSPGINLATCHRLDPDEAGDGRHAPPVGGCTCGLYALATPDDPRLRALTGGLVLGAVAAWGELEVHRAGFRAERACVLALAAPEGRAARRERAERAAARYGVALVPRALLALTAARYAQPVPESLLPGPAPRRRRRGAGAAALTTGVCPESHLWLDARGERVRLGLTRPLARALPGPVDLVLPEPGRRLERGDAAGSVAAGGRRLVLLAPLSGTLEEVNPRLADTPGALTAEPDGDGWLATIRPARWAAEAPELCWGPRAVALNEREVEDELEAGRDPFAHLTEERRRAAAGVGSWHDLRELLRARRGGPRFADGAQAEGEIGAALAARLADRARAARVARLGRRVAFALRAPAARIVLDARAPEASLAPACAPADLEFAGSAETVADWFGGLADPVSALRRGDLAADVPRLEALAAIGHLQPLCATSGPLRRAGATRRLRELAG